jgi:DNA-binding XRE family transcriptional regulator
LIFVLTQVKVECKQSSFFEDGSFFLHYVVHTVRSIKVRFGEKVRQARKRAGLSQEEVSKSVGVFRTYLSRIETGNANPTLLVMDAIAKVLGTKLWELLK